MDLQTIDDDKAIAVDEGGLNLVVKGERSFCEVGRNSAGRA